jgi:autotransporter-associated beta strand protein
VDTVFLFNPGAPAYTFGDGGDPARSLGLYTDTVGTGSANLINMSSNTQTFDVIVRTRIATIDAAAGEIVFNKEFRPGDGVNNANHSVILQGDHNIRINGPVTAYTGGNADRGRMIYRGATTTAENSGKLILGDIGTAYIGRIVVDSQKGGAVVATNNNSFGDGTYISGGRRDTFIGNPAGGTGELSNGVVELNGAGGDLTINEGFRIETRLSTGMPHIRNVAGNNTITTNEAVTAAGYVVAAFDGGSGAGADAFILESAAGKLTLKNAITCNLGISTNLYFQGSGNFDVGGATGISEDVAGAQINLIKRGSGTLTTLAGTAVRYAGPTTIEAGKYIMDGTHTASGVGGANVASGPYTVNAGATLGGSGTIGPAVNVAGVLAPGSSAGTLTVGGLTLTTATLSFELNSTDHTIGSGINDLIVNTGALDLSGGATLNVTGIGGNLTAGDYELIQFAGALTGTAANIALGTIPVSGGLSASIVIDSNSVNLHVGASHAGDFDGDGDVDGADFVAWQTNFPTASGATLAQGDADGDGDVDGADFVVWQTNFPFTPGPGASSVPEPNAIVIIGIGIGFVALRRRGAVRR